MELRAVLFDLDGVITDTAHYHYLAWKECAKKLGIDIDETFNEKLKGIDRANSLKVILEYGKVCLDEKDFTQCLKEKNDNYLKLIQKITHEDILPGIESLLKELKEAGIARILCSASKNAPVILKGLQIEDMFTGIVEPASLKAGKPAPDIFIAGAAMAKVGVENCVGIEDSIAGIQAIKAAGMCAVGIGNKELSKAKADVVVAHTEEITMLFLNKLMERK